MKRFFSKDAKKGNEQIKYVTQNLVTSSSKFSDAVDLMTLLLQDDATKAEASAAGWLDLLVAGLDSVNDLQLISIIWAVDKLSRQDNMKKELIKNGTYGKLSKALIRLTGKLTGEAELESLVTPFRNILCRGNDIREITLKQCPELFDFMASILVGPKSYSIQCAGIILMLAGFSPKSAHINKAYTEAIIPALANASVLLKGMAFDCLMEAAAADNARSILVSLGTKDLLQTYVGTPGYAFISCLILGLLAATDSPGDRSQDAIPTPQIVIDRIVSTLKNFCTEGMYDISTVRPFAAECKLILAALSSLATNESNLKALKTANVVSVLIELSQKRKTDLLQENLETLEQLARAMWVLAFDEECKQQLNSSNVISLFQSIKVDSASTKRALDGLIFTLKDNVDSVVSTDKKGHVMISYCWAQKDRMRELSLKLKSKGIPIWIDVDQMEGSVLEAMANAVESASVVIIGLSSQYKESQACRTEAEYAYKLKKEVIFVMAEDDYVPKGWLGILLGNKLWYNPFTNSGSLEAGVQELVKLISRFKPNISAAPTPPIHSNSLASLNSSSFMGLPDYYNTTTVPKIPENKEPLTPEMMSSKEKIADWDLEKVCRWLRMVKMDELLTGFCSHGFNGKTLVMLAEIEDINAFVKVLDPLKIDKMALALDLRYHLSGLFSKKKENIANWSTQQVSEWLSNNLPELKLHQSESEKWNGEVLLALFASLKQNEKAYHVFCEKVGVIYPFLKTKFFVRISFLLS